jgi:hypothetical protein
MTSPISRREFARASAASFLSALVPKAVFGDSASGTRRVTVRADSEIGVVSHGRPFHLPVRLG